MLRSPLCLLSKSIKGNEVLQEHCQPCQEKQGCPGRLRKAGRRSRKALIHAVGARQCRRGAAQQLRRQSRQEIFQHCA